MYGGVGGKANLALVLAVGLSIWTSQANAADLGGDCCGDLEERIAELEATAARKGNRKVSLTFRGTSTRRSCGGMTVRKATPTLGRTTLTHALPFSRATPGSIRTGRPAITSRSAFATASIAPIRTTRAASRTPSSRTRCSPSMRGSRSPFRHVVHSKHDLRTFVGRQAARLPSASPKSTSRRH